MYKYTGCSIKCDLCSKKRNKRYFKNIPRSLAVILLNEVIKKYTFYIVPYVIFLSKFTFFLQVLKSCQFFALVCISTLNWMSKCWHYFYIMPYIVHLSKFSLIHTSVKKLPLFCTSACSTTKLNVKKFTYSDCRK